jgi:hypothetical protein
MPQFDDCGIPIPVMVKSCLMNEGCASLKDAPPIHGRRSWLSVPHFGRRSLHKLEEVLRALGLSLEDE